MQERELTILFQFNGHTFEAYEVLGLTPGSPSEEVKSAYAEVLRTQDESEHEFFSMAYKAICNKSS